ncbi:hypothetical protein V2H45_03825 [Tumidithrix elongata RA019]|uniref:Uncharacterized protein n=1 Tax=Tumidithrix elongata BACA0141 TaxID=2716417 RepID=A0AAW9PQZ2_9CYAN|nr:hypothetical protein [Tumidithrix elongata RA019]
MKPQLSDVGLWWRWVLCTISGFLIGNVFGIPASLLGLYFLGPTLQSFGFCRQNILATGCVIFAAILIGAIVFGVAIGYLQWFVVRKLTKRSSWWILASTVGWTVVAIALGELAYMPVSGVIGNLDGSFEEVSFLVHLPALAIATVWVAFSGLLLGGLQWLILRRSLPRSLWWIGVNVGLMLAAAIAMIPILRGETRLLSLLFFFMGFLPIYAVVTGAAIVKIRHSS